MAKINFNDKTYLNQNPSIADENKVNDTDINELKNGVNDILQLMGLLTDTYSTSTSYVSGDRVIHNNQIYECISSTSGAWDSTKWSLVPLFYNQIINSSLLRDNYSTNETLTSKVWINGKPIYRKVINMGNLNNATGKSVNHGISNMDKTVGIMGIADNGSTYVLGAGFNDEIYWTKTAVIWNTKTNRTTYTAYVVLEYTKTTD